MTLVTVGTLEVPLEVALVEVALEVALVPPVEVALIEVALLFPATSKVVRHSFLYYLL